MSRSPVPRRRWARLAVAALLVVPGCARKEPPSGGPPDLIPPRVVSSVPDSATANVPRDVQPALTFSEAMEPRVSGDAVSIAPPVEIRQRRWHGRTLTLVFADSLAPDRTYTLFVAGTARDRHGNDYGTGKTVVFSTSATFPPGSISGRLEARGFSAGGTYLWCYDQAKVGVPDSTARDFDALGLAEDSGAFQIAGLAVPGRYRLWAFVDLNTNRSYEPTSDVLAAIDTTFELTTTHPRADSVVLRVVNPRAPGVISGTVADSLVDSTGVTHVVAVSARDSTKQVLVETNADGSFDLRVEAGTWQVRAFRDLNGDRTWQGNRERASERREVRVGPADIVSGVALTIRPRAGGP